jgi:AcrR family transcriptional regulator
MAAQDISIDPKAFDIIGSIRGVFATKGFDGASMQDLARAAGMSAGNFYRYFPSKDAIVETMVSCDLAQVQQQFAVIMNSADPRGTFRNVIRERVRSIAVDKDGPLWAEIEAASSRRPEIAAISRTMQETVVGRVSTVLARIAGCDECAASDFTHHATLIFMLIKGVAIQGCGHRAAMASAGRSPEPTPPALESLILGVIDTIISDAAALGARQPAHPG